MSATDTKHDKRPRRQTDAGRRQAAMLVARVEKLAHIECCLEGLIKEVDGDNLFRDPELARLAVAYELVNRVAASYGNTCPTTTGPRPSR